MEAKEKTLHEIAAEIINEADRIADKKLLGPESAAQADMMLKWAEDIGVAANTAWRDAYESGVVAGVIKALDYIRDRGYFNQAITKNRR